MLELVCRLNSFEVIETLEIIMEISEKVLAIGPATSIEINESVYRLKSEGLDPITLSYGEAPFKFDGAFNFACGVP